MSPTLSLNSNTGWFGQLSLFSQNKDSIGLSSFLDHVRRANQRAAWHRVRQRFVCEHWREENPEALAWLRQQMGVDLWTGLTIAAPWTLDIHDQFAVQRRVWHNEMLSHNDSRGVFKNDARSIEIVEGQPKLAWLIAAMQSTKPRAYPVLDSYYPGAFAYFQVLQMTGENPMDDLVFKEWVLNNKHPGFSENIGNIDGLDLFGTNN